MALIGESFSEPPVAFFSSASSSSSFLSLSLFSFSSQVRVRLCTWLRLGMRVVLLSASCRFRENPGTRSSLEKREEMSFLLVVLAVEACCLPVLVSTIKCGEVRETQRVGFQEPQPMQREEEGQREKKLEEAEREK